MEFMKNINFEKYFHIGNAEILELPKAVFLCSRKYPADTVLKSFDWAIEQRNSGRCVISGFHSSIEKEVLYFLLKGTQPIIMVLARGLLSKIEPKLQKAIDNGRLLIISPFGKEIKRVTTETAEIRNKFMIELADNIVIAHSTTGGGLERLLKDFQTKKTINYLS
jgi:predicted Rossmann fold nucleotide-binding protein DprA/Smf involved in DNA uptake